MGTDDYSPAPIAPGLSFAVPEEQELVLNQRDKEIAQAYFHPAWGGVEKIITQKIESLRIGCTNNSLDPVQYAVEDRANKKAAATLMDIWTQIQDAVTATERQGD